jgi:hypothetical protein
MLQLVKIAFNCIFILPIDSSAAIIEAPCIITSQAVASLHYVFEKVYSLHNTSE